MRVQDTTEDQMANGDRRLEGIAHHIVEVVVNQPFRVGEPDRMNKKGRSRETPPSRTKVVSGMRTDPRRHVRVDLDSMETKLLHNQSNSATAIYLERHGAHADEAVGVRSGERCDIVIDRSRRRDPQFGFRPIVGLGREGDSACRFP